MYVVGDWVEGNVGNLYFSDWCSPPRKEKISKPPTGENVVPHEQISRVNPNGGEQEGIPEKEYPGIANPKEDPSWRQTELIPRCQRDNSNEDTSWRWKELFPRRQQKQRGIPEREYPGISITKGDPSWRQKEVNSKVPAGQLLRSVKFLRRSELAPKELIPRCQWDISAPTEFEIQIWVLNFRRNVEYIKIRGNEFSSLHGSLFLPSRRSENKTDVCYNFKNPLSHPWINSLFHLEANSLRCCFN